MATHREEQPHLCFLSIPGMGHVNPLLHFANRLLSSAKVSVTFVYSTRIYHLLQRQQRKDALGEDQPHFHVEVVPDGLPTDDSRSPSPEEWSNGLKLLEKGIEDLIEKSLASGHHPVSCIVSDNFLVCAQRIANKYGLRRADLWCASAGVYSIGFHIPLLSSQGFIPYKGQKDMITFIPGLLPMRASDFPKAFLAEDTSHHFFQLLVKAFEASKEADWVLLNTVFELESSVVDSLRAEKLPVLTIGPLIPRPIYEGIDEERCLAWLDTQEEESVVYVAFGSMASLSEKEVEALAMGLQLTQKPFLCALRAPSLVHLPHEFVEETHARGLIVSWAPQFSVLCHPSVGGFVSHCGWNSMMESFYAGVPIIGWPKQAEQRSNLKFITDQWKVGISVEAEEESGCVKKENVETAIRRVMDEEEGRTMRKRMRELRMSVKNAGEAGGTSWQNVEKFLDDVCKPKLKDTTQKQV